MKRRRLYIIIYIIAAALLTACHHHDEEPKYPVMPTAHRTIIFYMAGQNDLNSQLQANIESLVAARASIPDSCYVIIFRDSSDKSVISRLTLKDGLTTWYEYPENLNSCDSTVMLEVLQRIIRHFPAKHYGLSYGSHATGWVPRKNAPRKTLGVDYGQIIANGTMYMSMNVNELRWTLEHLPHFDYLFFDVFCRSRFVLVALLHDCTSVRRNQRRLP